MRSRGFTSNHSYFFYFPFNTRCWQCSDQRVAWTDSEARDDVLEEMGINAQTHQRTAQRRILGCQVSAQVSVPFRETWVTFATFDRF